MSSLNATQTPSESQAVAGYAERIPIPIFFLILFLIFAYVVGSFSAFVTLRNLPGIRHRGIFLAATLTGSEVLLIIFDSFRKAVPNYWCGIHFFLPALAIPGSALSVTAQSIRLVHMWTLHTDLAQSNFTSGSGSNEQRKERQKRPPWWIRYRPWLTDRTLAFIALLLILMMIAIVSLLTTADSSITWRNFSQDNPEAPCSTRSPLLFVPLGTFIGFFLLIVTPTFWWLSRNINDTFEIRKDLRYGIVVGGVGVAGGLFWELGITRIFPQVPVSGNLIFGLFQVVGFQTCLVLMPVLREWKVEKLRQQCIAREKAQDLGLISLTESETSGSGATTLVPSPRDRSTFFGEQSYSYPPPGAVVGFRRKIKATRKAFQNALIDPMLRELLIAYSRRDFCTENILFYIAYHNLAQRCAEYWVQQLIPQSDSNSLSDQSLNSGEEPMEQSAADIISVVRDLSTAQMGGVHAPNPDMYPYEPQRIATVSAAASISGFNHHPNSTNPEVSSSQFVLPPLALPNMDLAAAVNAVLDSWIAPAHALSNTARHRYSRNPASPHFRMPAQQVPESLVGQFIEIFDLFFKPGSELELNLPQEKMRTVRKHFAAMMEHGLGMKVLPNQKSSKVKTGKLSPMPWDVLTPPRSITHDPLPSHVIRTPGTQMDYGMQSEYGETMELQRMHQHSRDYHRQSEYSTPTTIVPSQPQTPWYVPPPPPMTAMRGERNWGDGRMHLEHAGPTVPVVPSRRQNTLYEPSVNEYGGDHEWGARSESAWSRAASTAEIRQVRHEPSWSSGGRGGHDVHTYAQNGQTDNEDFVTHSVAIPIPSAKQQQYPAPVNSVPTAAKLQVLMDVFDASKVDVVDMLYENTFLKFVRELESGTVLA